MRLKRAKLWLNHLYVARADRASRFRLLVMLWLWREGGQLIYLFYCNQVSFLFLKYVLFLKKLN